MDLLVHRKGIFAVDSSQRWCAVPVQRHGGYLEGQGLRERVSSNSIDGWKWFILRGIVQSGFGCWGIGKGFIGGIR